ncbi:hypothetical protein ACHAXR_002054 [Thalassiosira sp. AJA248-18]
MMEQLLSSSSKIGSGDAYVTGNGRNYQKRTLASAGTSTTQTKTADQKANQQTIDKKSKSSYLSVVQSAQKSSVGSKLLNIAEIFLQNDWGDDRCGS